jgi:hypothetical protein
MMLEVSQECPSGGRFVAKFLKTNDISAQLENIIRGSEAGEKLVLVSPYVQVSPRLFENLKDANKRRVKITLIYGKKELEAEEREKLDTLQNLSLYFKESLHAKCYYNEKQLIITSMNLYDFSEKTNYEMGVLVQKDEDRAIYDLAVEEVEIIRGNSDVIKGPSSLAAMGKAVMGKVVMGVMNDFNDLVDDAAGTPRKGFCVRCGQPIDFDTRHPLCPAHYAKWSVYKKPDYPEKYCHRCGESSKVSKREPLCPVCSKRR